MYCPRCAAQNNDDVKYCRACGENLSVVALVLEKRLPARLITRLDSYLEWKDERLRRDSIVSGVSGAVFLFLSLFHLVREGLSFTVGFTFVFALALFFWGGWYYLVYRRALSAAGRRAALAEAGGAELQPPRDSVTEGTTKHLDAARPREKS
ncbi:MAG TPA: zinc-ribbon domain-containing protein [Pyrinomonadaceae bacterium]|jgi:hypothetical protein|nr:zinc-ribbon domain-containing protein [Pyrinomonadaceae bacterium]